MTAFCPTSSPHNPARTRRSCGCSSVGGSPCHSVCLPPAPKTASRVPWLTSIHGTPGRGNYGESAYRGNCSGLLIKDLLNYYQPGRVLDPMSGGDTCGDVCREMNIDYSSGDIRLGFDATDPDFYRKLGRFEFVWLHPPYWRMIRWGDDPRCLANAPTLKDFQARLRAVIRNCVSVLAPNGVIAILMGDYIDGGRYLALPFRTMNIAAAEELELAAPEIVRFSHGATSSRKTYQTSFIPRLHDVCLVLRRSSSGRMERADAGRQRGGGERGRGRTQSGWMHQSS